MQIKYSVTNKFATIFIEDIIHTVINLSNFLGFQTYYEGDENRMIVELYFKSTTTTVKLEYDTKLKWLKIIDIIEEIFKYKR